MLAERLKLIRQARGLSLDELSAAMDGIVTKQALSKYETGKDQPSPRILRSLASALGVPANNLIEAPTHEVETVDFRKAAKLGKKAQAHFESLLRMKLEEAMELRGIVEPSPCFDVPVLKYSIEKVEDVEKRASELREHWVLGSDPIPNLVEVLESAGVLVVEADGGGAFDGLSATARDKTGAYCGAAVMAREGVCRERQRLTLAHEVAHVVLRIEGDLNEEKAAFRFAGAFLAPAETLRVDVGRHRSRVLRRELELLRSRYGMSMQALLKRMVDLGIISPAYYKEQCIWFSRTGERQHENGETKEGEKTAWLARTVYRALGEGLITYERAERILGEPIERDGGDTFIGKLRKMKPDERERFIEAQMNAVVAVDQGLDLEWMNGAMERGS